MVKTKVRIGFAGTPKIAFDHFSKLLEIDNISIEFVLTQPNKASGRGLIQKESLFANQDNKIPVYQPENLNSQSAKDLICSHAIDLMVVVAYGKLIPNWLLTHPKNGCLNVHFSLLPEHRGAAPMQRAIANGDKVSGVSFMKLDEGLDEGPVYEKVVTNIENKDFYEVEDLLLESSINKIGSVIESIQDGLEAQNQDHSKASYAEKIDKDEGKINWHLPSAHIKNKFRAFKKWPQCYFDLKGEKTKILSLDIDTSRTGRPGEVCAFDKQSLDIFCKDGVVSITAVQFPGKKVISSLDFFNSKRDIISKGDLLI